MEHTKMLPALLHHYHYHRDYHFMIMMIIMIIITEDHVREKVTMWTIMRGWLLQFPQWPPKLPHSHPWDNIIITMIIIIIVTAMIIITGNYLYIHHHHDNNKSKRPLPSVPSSL